MIQFTLKHPRANYEMLGYTPSFLSEDDPRSAKEQINTAYVFGGFQPFQGFKMTKRGLEYPGDPPMILIAEAKLRKETIQIYQAAWVAIIQEDGSFEVARID